MWYNRGRIIFIMVKGGHGMNSDKDSRIDAEEDEKPTCALIGTDGNAFAIIGKVSKTLKRAGMPEKAKEFKDRAMSASSYDEVLAMTFDYVDVE